MCMYMCIYIHIYTYIHMYVYMCICVYVCIYIYIIHTPRRGAPPGPCRGRRRRVVGRENAAPPGVRVLITYQARRLANDERHQAFTSGVYVLGLTAVSI